MSLKWELFWWGILSPIFVAALLFWSLWLQSFSISICFLVSGGFYVLAGPYLLLMWWLIPEKEWKKYKGYRK